MTKLMTKKQKIIITLILGISLIAFITMFFIEPIPQIAKYSDFIDKRNIFGIPNFYNVISNIPFLFVGIYAFVLLKKDKLSYQYKIKFIYYTMSLGVVGVFFGSSYFHLDENNQTLFFDRLPMVIIFMSIFSIVISEFVHLEIGKKLFPYLLFIGLASITYWIVGELNGAGDLRLYGLVQFLPMLIIPIILLSFQNKSHKVSAYWYLLFAYIFAKVFEFFDACVFKYTSIISGHSIKHFVSALGILMFFQTIKKQKRQ